VKHLNNELKNLANAKKKLEEQLSSLKRDHGRIQDRLKSSSESRAKSVDEARTFSVLKNSNAQMTARWQKEKQIHQEAVTNLKATQSVAKKFQGQYSKTKREIDKLTKQIDERELEEAALKSQLRSAKTASFAANLRARKAQMLQSRKPGAVQVVS
jgi:chromosome segregation ATPase